MDSTITFEEVVALLARCPLISPRPNFENLREAQKYIIRVCKGLLCPQSPRMGWAGIIMNPNIYSMVEPVPFLLPADPGEVPAYPRHRTLPRSEQATIDRQFERQKRYFNNMVAIYRAIYQILDLRVDDAYKTSSDRWAGHPP